MAHCEEFFCLIKANSSGTAHHCHRHALSSKEIYFPPDGTLCFEYINWTQKTIRESRAFDKDNEYKLKMDLLDLFRDGICPSFDTSHHQHDLENISNKRHLNKGNHTDSRTKKHHTLYECLYVEQNKIPSVGELQVFVEAPRRLAELIPSLIISVSAVVGRES